MSKGRGRTISMSLAFAGVGVVAALTAARRNGSSLRGWLVADVALPLLHRRRPGLENLSARIAENRSAGPAMPPARVRTAYRFEDALGDVRTFRLRPKESSTNRRVLYIHGGAYVFDLMAVQWPVASGLVDRLDADVVMPLYPLAPEHRVEAGLRAVERCYSRLVDEVGAANVVVAGDSAGGGLALALAHRLRDLGAPLPAAMILLFPWLDATCSSPDQREIERRDPILSVDQLQEAGAMWAGDAGPTDLRVSPLFASQEGLPPTLVLVGTRDVLLPDARRFVAEAPSAVLHEYPGMFHGFVCAPIPEAIHALDLIDTFGRQHLRP